MVAEMCAVKMHGMSVMGREERMDKFRFYSLQKRPQIRSRGPATSSKTIPTTSFTTATSEKNHSKPGSYNKTLHLASRDKYKKQKAKSGGLSPPPDMKKT